jgi:hypothetical protein
MTLDDVIGDVRPDELAALLEDDATAADAIALWTALENPWEMVDDYRQEVADD